MNDMNNSKEVAAFKKKIHKFLMESMYLHKTGGIEHDYNRYPDEEEFDPSGVPKELTIPMLKYYLDNLTEEFKNILNAPDAVISKDWDLEDGIYSVTAKSLDNGLRPHKRSPEISTHFSFTYKHNDLEDFTVFMPDRITKKKP